MKDTFPCPCCGYMVFEEPPGSYEICPICFWEDDPSQLRFQRTTGANHVSLVDGQRNYERDGDSFRMCDWQLVQMFAILSGV